MSAHATTEWGARVAQSQRRDTTEGTQTAVAVEAFDRHPYGIIVLDPEGRLIGQNRAARRLLGRSRFGAPGRPFGCDLLGCRRPEGPLEDVCLHERALEADGPLPEIRIDLPESAGAAAAWVTVARTGSEPERIIMELRPGSRDDRRRRTRPHWITGPTLRIEALGRTRVLSAEGPIEGRWLANRAGQVLKFLVTERNRTVYADEIVEKLTPSAGLAGTAGLRYFIHVLRDQLEPDRPPGRGSSFVLAARGGYLLDTARVWVDASEFETKVEAGLAAYERGDEGDAVQCLSRGLALYRGDFLADEPYAEWAFHERDRLRQIAANGLRALAELREHVDDLAGAIACLERLADLEPFDVNIHRDLLVALLRRGSRSLAMRRYDTLRRRMVNSFGEELDFSLADLLPASSAISRRPSRPRP
jgi:DNA-binding SARP family transcriptional activator